MSIVDIQRRLRTLGKIRMGDKGGRGQPQRLDKFRLTSPSQGLIESVAAQYGGESRVWQGSPDGDQWEVYTDASELPIAIPPMAEPFSQHYELWSAAGCQRRCDGERVVVATDNGISERKCMCDADDRECKLTTRASVILPEIPGIGVWSIESHGYNAAVEMTGALGFLGRQASQGVYLEAVLRLEQRSKRVPGQPVSRFVVPVIDTPNVGIGQIMLGAGSMPVVTPQIASRERPALPAPPPSPAAGETAIAVPVSGEVVEGSSPSWGSAPPPPSGEAARREEPGEDTRPITEPQRKRMFAIAKKAGVSTGDLKEIILGITGQDSSAGIVRERYDEIIEEIEKIGAGQLVPPADPPAPYGGADGVG